MPWPAYFELVDPTRIITVLGGRARMAIQLVEVKSRSRLTPATFQAVVDLDLICAKLRVDWEGSMNNARPTRGVGMVTDLRQRGASNRDCRRIRPVGDCLCADPHQQACTGRGAAEDMQRHDSAKAHTPRLRTFLPPRIAGNYLRRYVYPTSRPVAV